MIITVKASKLDKVNTQFFNICSVSKELIDANIANCDILLPTSDLYVGRMDKKVGKKKFKKKYEKYITKKNTMVERYMYTLGVSLAQKNNICFTCSDDEYKLGYIQIIAKTLADQYGVEYNENIKEVNDSIKDELSNYSKKERKLLDEDEELGGKKRKLRKEIIKTVNKALGAGMGEEGKDELKKQSKRYAIDMLAIECAGNGVFEVHDGNDGTSIRNIDITKYEGKSKDLTEAILAPKDDKAIGSLVKEALKTYGIKYNKKDLKDLGTEKLIPLLGQLYLAITAYRMDGALD